MTREIINEKKDGWEKDSNVNVRVGDKVLIKNMSTNTKYDPVFKGPYDVVEHRDPNVVANI